MPSGAMDLKQTPRQPLSMLGGPGKFSSHHARPFRRRHVLLLLISLIFAGSLVLELATIITKQTIDPRALFAVGSVADTAAPIVNVRSSNGFSLSFNPSQFTAKVQSKTVNGTISDAELSKNNPLDSVIITPLPSQVPAQEAATQLQVIIEPDAAAFATFKEVPRPKSDLSAITADYFAPKSSNLAVVREEARTTELIGGSLMTKAIYIVEPKFAGNPTRTIVWTTQVKNKPAALTVTGIINGSEIPGSLSSLVQSVQFDTDIKVKGLSFLANDPPEPTLDQKYIADLVSPAVVKVYHIICGSLIFDNQPLATDSCSGQTGSGFIVSSDGYIATNGHVVVYGAKDMLVNALLSNRTLLEQFLRGTKLASLQVNQVLQQPELVASVISGIYDIPDSRLRLTNQRELTVIATGSTPFEIKNEAALKSLINNFEPTDDLKQATVLGYDYAAKDQLTLVASPKEGFSASDVALLKINVSEAPALPIATNPATQNQSMSLFGFPGDAENQLTDNSRLDVSVTNGNINAIRQAAGDDAKLYQSDADASKGSSGGPAVDADGKVFGLLTYRFASGQQVDSAKSYIRDIKDLTDLAADKQVVLKTDSQTQSAWRLGLELYSKHHYSKAVIQFEKVRQLYPTHRLVSQYIDQSKQAIRDGKDINEPPAFLLWFGIGAGMGGMGGAVLLIARHHGRHQLYRAYHRKPTLQHS